MANPSPRQAWNRFVKTGHPSDYMAYRAASAAQAKGRRES